MSEYVDPEIAFPRLEDVLCLYDYPTKGVKSYVKVSNIQYSTYEYTPAANITGTSASDYSANKIDNLVPNNGHLYLVIPTVNPEEVLYTAPSAATGNVTILADDDCNTRVISAAANGTAAQVAITVHESIRVRVKYPPTVPLWGVDQLGTPGYIDYRYSSPEHPNASFMIAITDLDKTGQFQMRFEMPANNLSAATGMKCRMVFYIAFVEFAVMNVSAGAPSKYTPIPTVPPSQGVDALGSPSTRAKQGDGVVPKSFGLGLQG